MGMGPARRASRGREPRRGRRAFHPLTEVIPCTAPSHGGQRSPSSACWLWRLPRRRPRARAGPLSPTARPDWATPNAQVGSVPDSAQHTFWVYLSMRNSKALDAAIAAVTNPASAELRPVPDARPVPRPLRADRRRRGRGPRLPQAGRLRRQRRPARQQPLGQGQRHDRQVEQAFKTQLRTYQHRGKTLQAPNGDLSIARSISSRIAGIAGLDGSDRLMRPDTADAPPAPAFVNAPPCSTSWGEKHAVDDNGQPDRPARLRPAVPAVRDVRLHAQPAAGRLRHQGSGRRRPRRPRPDGGDRRRLRVADDRAGRQPVRDDPRPAGGGLQPDQARGSLQRSDRRPRPVRRAGLVRRGDARRRGRARHGARRPRALRRRRRLPRRVAHRRGQQDRRRQPGPDRLELLRQPRRDR